jgi:Zn-dependent protease/predicted transcriptional regulator
MSKPREHAGSSWSLKLGTVAGIPIRIHFTFVLLLLLLWVFSRDAETRGLVWLIPAIFFCVLLHELGHALAARRYRVQTRDITLYPIGGVAMLQGRRPKPNEEFWIAIAGPAVNLAIVIILAPILLAMEGGLPRLSLMLADKTFLQGLFIGNLVLVIFNMIPAFPMDGGRVLRAVLAMRMPEEQATRIAGSIGQFLAIVIGFVGIMMMNVLLMLIAFFVFLGAGQEMATTVGLSLIAGRRVRDAMQVRFRTIESGQPLEHAAQMLLAGSQQDFPVVAGEEVVGLLTRRDIARGLAIEGPTAYVAGFMDRDVRSLRPDEPLERAMELFNSGDTSPILVYEAGQMVGMVTGENLSEFLMLEHARRARAT